jgi:hypothetical protein
MVNLVIISTSMVVPLIVGGFPIPSRDPLFLALLAIHVPSGFVAAGAGLVAMLMRKGPGRHPFAGTVYFRALSVVFVTTVALSFLRWTEDYHLLVLGSLSFLAATIGRAARRQRRRNWRFWHVAGMGSSYILLLTAFYVDNGRNLPIWRTLPSIAYWTVPALVGIPLIAYALLRHERLATGEFSSRAPE